MKENFYFYHNLAHNSMIQCFYQIKWEEENPQDLVMKLISQLTALAQEYGFTGNVWKKFIAFAIVEDENPFSLAAEWKIDNRSTIYQLAESDISKLLEMFHYDWSDLENKLNRPIVQHIVDYKGNSGSHRLSEVVLDNIRQLSQRLSETNNTAQATEAIADHYHKVGVGRFGLFHAFRLDELEPLKGIVPVDSIVAAKFSNLVGYEQQKRRIMNNTDSFVQGKSANNVMLHGDSGTGKSTCIKAVLNEYAPQKLRMIEIYKHQFIYLPAIIREIKKRNYYFIIYMDDLSFEADEVEYKYLKAVIEGGLEVKPSNVLIYATSNRRHFVREQWKDRADFDEEVHSSDTMEEKLSLAYRFGISIFFPSPTQNEFREIVRRLAERHQIVMESEQLLEEAHRWELRHGGLSGRTAQQFIDHIKGSSDY